MSDLQGQPAEIRIVLQITRAATGKTEELELIGRIEPTKEEDGNDTQHSSAQRGD